MLGIELMPAACKVSTLSLGFCFYSFFRTTEKVKLKLVLPDGSWELTDHSFLVE